MTNVKCIYLMVAGMFVFAVVLTCVSLFPVVFSINVEQTNAAFIKDVPALAELIATEPTFGGFHPDFTKSSIDLILNIAFGLTVVCPVFIIAICTLFYYKMKQLKQHVSVATYAVHIMMLRTMICETIIKFFFVATPCFFFALTIKFELLWGSYTATPAFAIFMMQLFLECLTLIYFIKPYRNYIMWLVFRRKSIPRHSVVGVKISRTRTSSYPLTEVPNVRDRIANKRFSVFA